MLVAGVTEQPSEVSEQEGGRAKTSKAVLRTAVNAGAGALPGGAVARPHRRAALAVRPVRPGGLGSLSLTQLYRRAQRQPAPSRVAWARVGASWHPHSSRVSEGAWAPAYGSQPSHS